jgi:polynucleotide 5'-hydroxyl-kinase GRC3/NOL9
VSLHVISSPVFGPSFAHLATPIKAYFMGDSSVEEVLEPYSQAIRSLVDHYHTGTLPGTSVPLSQLPLLVNTHGWLKGLGYEALRNAVNYLAPNVAVHLYPIALEQTEKGPDFPFVEEELGFRFASVHLLPAITQRRPRMPLGPDDLRRLRLDAYFDCWGEGSLVTQIPYRVPWNAIRLAFMDADVPPSECLLAFNASLVGLCVDTADYLPCAPPGQVDLTRGQSVYPSFLLSAPRCECIGLGIVRTIDPVAHQFFVLTPVPPDQLQRVNTLVKGAMFLPAPTLQRGVRAHPPLSPL